MPTRQPITPESRERELGQPGALAALHAQRVAAVVRWRSYRAGDRLHRPEPLASELGDDAAVRWLPDGAAPAPDDMRVGYDGRGASRSPTGAPHRASASGRAAPRRCRSCVPTTGSRRCRRMRSRPSGHPGRGVLDSG